MYKIIAIFFLGWFIPLSCFESRMITIKNDSPLLIKAKYQQPKASFRGSSILEDRLEMIKNNEEVSIKVLADKNGTAMVQLAYFLNNIKYKQEDVKVPKDAFIHIQKKPKSKRTE